MLELGIFIVAISALAVSLITAIIQIMQHRQELRPYLSFSGTSGHVTCDDTVMSGIVIELNMKNVGKNVLHYDVVKFELFANNAEMPRVYPTNTGTVIGVDTEVTYCYWNNDVSIHHTKERQVELKICFSMEYHKVGRPRKKYMLSYEVFAFVVDGVYQEGVYGKTYAT